jgi:hypothetical protein
MALFNLILQLHSLVDELDDRQTFPWGRGRGFNNYCMKQVLNTVSYEFTIPVRADAGS